MSTPTKLPEGLPKLPPVPVGYDRWEYKGRDWMRISSIDTWASCTPRYGSVRWGVLTGNRPVGADDHYIVAVRDAKPAKKTTKPSKKSYGSVAEMVADTAPKKKAKRVKVRSAVAYPHWANSFYTVKNHGIPHGTPVLVLPFDAASREAIVGAAIEAAKAERKPGPFCRDCADNDGLCPHGGRPCDPDERITRAILAVFHPDFAKEGR